MSFNGLPALWVKERKCLHRTFQVAGGYELFLELAYDRPLLLQGENGVAAEFIRSGLHLLAIQGYQARIRFIRLGNGKHHAGEVLYLQRIFKANGNTGFGKQVNE